MSGFSHETADEEGAIVRAEHEEIAEAIREAVTRGQLVLLGTIAPSGEEQVVLAYEFAEEGTRKARPLAIPLTEGLSGHQVIEVVPLADSSPSHG